MRHKNCPRCNGAFMIKSPTGCNKSITIRCGEPAVDVEQYVCPKCGYIEQYAKIQDNNQDEMDEDTEILAMF